MLRHRRTPRRTNPLAFFAVLVLSVMAMTWLAGRFGLVDLGFLAPSVAVAPGSGSPTPSGSGGGPRPTQSGGVAIATSTPTARPSPSPTPTPTPTPTPSPTPTASPTPRPSPTPAPSRPPAPTYPPTGLLILQPTDGQTVRQSTVDVRGLAAPGSPITWDRPFWFDDHTTADRQGRWSFQLQLPAGDNALTFRVGDDRKTAVTIIVRYQP